MKNISWLSRLLSQQPATHRQIAGCIGAATLLLMAGAAAAQTPIPYANMDVPNGYVAHGSVNVGGHMVGLSGSDAMYDTMINTQSGPRMMGETFEMRALPTTKHTLVDTLSAVGSGFGGDPYNFLKLDFSKGRIYEFSGMFRRDRQYFDYDLLGNPGIASGYSIPVSGSTTPYAWPQVNQSPFMYNTVRRMTDTHLTLFPLAQLTYRAGYSHDTFEGPSLTPSGNSVAGQEVILEEYQRLSSDNYSGGVDWKPIHGTQLTFEEQIDHNKLDSYFKMDPSYYTAQEADGTKVALLDSYQNFAPYTNSSCNTSSMISKTAILYSNPAGGLPIIDPACNVITSYYRSQPTREIFPTEILRLQSSTLKNIEMNGDIRYTSANMNMPNYYEDFKGLEGTKTGGDRELATSGLASAKREAIAVDYGIVWQAMKTVSLSDQLSFSNVHQPGTAEFTGGTTVTVPTTAGEETINYTGLTSTPATTGGGPGAPGEGGPSIGTPNYDYFGQKFVTNNASITWDATPRSSYTLTYRYGTHDIAEGSSNNTSTQTGEETFSIHENGVILNAALHPANNWDLNGSAEILYYDNVFTPVAPRQSKQYRVHTMYRPKSWATITGTFNDRERHDNTNNTGTPSAVGPLNHEDHTRIVSVGADLMPSEHYGLDVNYTYDDVYTATNGCFQGAAGTITGSAVAPGIANATGSLCAPVSAGHGSNTVLVPGRDFEDAPTQYGSASIVLSPNTKLHSDLGYRVNSVNGTRFFTDASDVNGSLVSTYQTPFVSASWTVHPGLVWKAEYDYFGYGEGGRSGAQYCNDNPGLAVGATSETVVPCNSVANTAMSATTPVYGFTAPRNFHANNLTLSMHYDF